MYEHPFFLTFFSLHGLLNAQVELGARSGIGVGGGGGGGAATEWDSWGDDDESKAFEQTGFKSRQAKAEDSISSLFEEMCGCLLSVFFRTPPTLHLSKGLLLTVNRWPVTPVITSPRHLHAP